MWNSAMTVMGLNLATEDRLIGEQFIQATEPKDELKAYIIHLHFETYVRGKHVVTSEVESCIPIEDLYVPMLIDYEPCKFWKDV